MSLPGQLSQRFSGFRGDDARNLQFTTGMLLRLPLISLYFNACIFEYPTPLDLSSFSAPPEIGLFLLVGGFDYTILTLVVWILQAISSKSTNLRLELLVSIASMLVRMHLVGWTVFGICFKKMKSQENRPLKAILLWIKTCPVLFWIILFHWTGIRPVTLRSWIISIMKLYFFGQWDFVDAASIGSKSNITSSTSFWSWNTVLQNLKASAIGVPIQIIAQYIPTLILLGVLWLVRLQSEIEWQAGIDALVLWLKQSPPLRRLGRKLCRIQEDISTVCNLWVNVLNHLAIDTYKSFISKMPWVSPKTGQSPSSASGKRIRLLKVHAAGLMNPIRCTLDWSQLGPSTPSYTAISYVWGSSDKCCEITINDKPFRTTKSAARVLSALRSSWITKTFWIDAICIDQEDDRDKECQIPYMAEIYEKAAKVAVWLGDAEDGHMATSLARNLWFRASLAREFGGSLAIKAINADAWKALGTMLSHPWFQRVWIIQEVVVAKGGDLGADSVIIRHERLANNYSGRTITNVRAIEEFRSVYRREGPNLSLLFYLGRLFRSDLKFEATVTKDRIYALLNLTSQGLCIDSDVAVSKALVPNYCQTDGKLFTDIAEHLLRTLRSDQRLDVLVHAGILPGNRTSNLPTWAPDWSAQPVSLPFIGLDGTKELLSHVVLSSRLLGLAAMRSHGDYSLSKMLGHIEGELSKKAAKISDALYHAGSPLFKMFKTPDIFFRQLRQKAQLGVAGIGIGRVAHLASQFGPIGTPLKIQRHGSVRLNPAAFLPRDWRAFASEHSNLSAMAYGRAVTGELTQTWIELTEEGIPTKDYLPVASLSAKVQKYERFLDTHFACESTEQEFFIDDADHEFYKLDKSIRTICSGRILGVTDQGRLGLFPAGTRIGDTVSVFVDASVPFVLRAVGGEVGEDGIYELFHQLVGPCYAQGIMYGEALYGVSAEQLRWYKME